MLSLTPWDRFGHITASRSLWAQGLWQVVCWDKVGFFFFPGDPRQGLGTCLGDRMALRWVLQHPLAHGG